MLSPEDSSGACSLLDQITSAAVKSTEEAPAASAAEEREEPTPDNGDDNDDGEEGEEGEEGAEDGDFYWDNVVKVRVRSPEDDENYLGEDVFKVERIVDRRRADGEIQYFIKWEGWSR
eukprot:4149710-Prymnesium_polylepis.1